jgi:SAM-dependent methyltransferase
VPRRKSLFTTAATRRRDAAAQALDGCKVQVNGSVGTAKFVDAARRPRYFDIEFEDGSRQEECTTTYVRHRLVASAAAAAQLSSSDQQPWAYSSATDVHAALQALMPGPWSPKHMTRLSTLIGQALSQPHLAPLAPTDISEVQYLLTAMDFTQVGSILDPWAGTGTVKLAFEGSGLPVVDNDINPRSPALWHENALQPSFYLRVAQRVSIGAVVTSPWFTVLDLALPLAVSAAQSVACVHVPGHYLTDAHPSRVAYLRRLMQEGRIHFLWNLPKGPSGRRCCWILIFASAAYMRLLLKSDNLDSASVSFLQE